jgi:RND superfamily putative drug exporter
VWIALAALLLPFATKLPEVTNDDYVLPGGSQTAELHRTLRERFPGGDQRAAVIVYRRAGGLTQQDHERIVEDAKRAGELEGVANTIPPFGPGAQLGLFSSRGDTALTIAPINAGEVFRVRPTIEALREMLPERGGLEVHVTGFPAITSDINSAVKEADVKLLLATILLVLTLLFYVYRSPVLALIPLLVVGLAYVVAAGVIYGLNRTTGFAADSTSTAILLVLMFGAGTDYCLLLIARYRAAHAHHDEAGDALREAVPEAAPAIVASALTVAAALLVLLAGTFGVIRTLGPLNAIGVLVVLAATLTLLPALLSILGDRAFWPLLFAEARYGERGAPRWERRGRAVRRRPALYLLASLVLLGAGMLGLLAYHTDDDPLRQFRVASDSIKGYEVVAAAFPPGVANPTTALIDRRNGRLQPSDVQEVSRSIMAVGDIAAVIPTGRRSHDGRAATLAVLFADNPFTPAALKRVEKLRRDVGDARPGVRVIFGDGSAERLDYDLAIKRDAKVLVPLVLLVVFAALVLLLRALVAPVYLLGTVILSYLGTLGACFVIFPHVFGRPMEPLIPLIIFIFLVALGSDYNIFLMARAREEAVQDGTRKGMLSALVATGPVITNAGLILAGTFSVLMILPIFALFSVGFAVMLGVLIDTFVIRSLCVPAITWLLGERSWWPSKAVAGRRSTLVRGVSARDLAAGTKRRR